MLSVPRGFTSVATVVKAKRLQQIRPLSLTTAHLTTLPVQVK
jgi:hypothetical protein